MATAAARLRHDQKSFKRLRLAILVGFLLFSTVLGILHQFAPGTKPVGVDALDPFGGVESAISLIFSGSLLERIAWSSFILLFATLAAAILFRRVFCGTVCAFGALQELFGKLGRFLFGARLVVPLPVDRAARFLKYAVLAGVVVWTVLTATLVIRPYDPWAAYHHLLSAELLTGFGVGLVILVASLAGSMLYDRFFCKYLCPMGAFLGLINPGGWFRVRRNEETCTHCFSCDKACPVNVKVESVSHVRSRECINCGLCVAACPVENTLVIGGPRGARRVLSPVVMLVVTIGIFVAVLGTTTAARAYQWTVVPLAESAKGAAPLNPDDIKGTDTFAQVSALSGIPRQAFLGTFGISVEEFEKPIRESAHKPGSTFETEDVRSFVRTSLVR